MKLNVKAKFDVIIIGSGISGLICAIELAQRDKNVLIISKEAITESSSTYAQGGIAIPLRESDSIETHVKDTINAGSELCEKEIAYEIISHAREAYEKLLSYGIQFDLGEGNKIQLTKEAAHSESRVCHIGGDATGKYLTKTLIDIACRMPNIFISQGTFALSILKNTSSCACGVFVEDITKDRYVVLGKDIIVATGGIGQIFKNTTNPKVSTGDGLAMAHYMGAELQDIEMIQFHPTVLIQKNFDPILITEAIRGEGGKLRNVFGEYFAKNYHVDGELAPRDILSRAISLEMKKTNSSFVYLDISNFSCDYFKNRFPTVFYACMDRKIDLFKTGVEVLPAAHYFIGGVKSNLCGETCVKNLWVIGEAASNGFHGANRLASNSLLECIVTPYFLVNELIKHKTILNETFNEINISMVDYEEKDINYLTKELQNKNLDALGLFRNEKKLNEHFLYLENISQSFNLAEISANSNIQEFKNMLYISKLICKACLFRKESIGVHYREDYIDAPLVFNHQIIDRSGNPGFFQKVITV